ncbi:MAG TPA: FAD-binding oxidoreductase [Thermoanaerobaculia bacterium]|nr:FAD-binding oxidoreductase [Thermoanaerobaculia bacterium]
MTGVLRARRLPADGPGCGWIEALPAPPPARRLTTTLRAAAVVVGAGFTGLAAARRLAESLPGERIVLLDAQRAGWGAAGRSSGFVVDLASFVAALPALHAERFVRLSRHGIAALRERVEAGGIDCAWDDRGWIHAAGTDGGLVSLAALTRWLEARGEPFERLDSEALAAVTGSAYYRAGVRLPGSVLVQPYALVRGLAETLPPNVELYERTPALRLRPGHRAKGRPVHVETPQGRVVADRALVGTNAGMPSLGLLADRIFPLFTTGSLTGRLTAAEAAALGGEPEWGLLAQDVLGSSLRRTRDGRLLVRNSVHFDARLELPPDWRRAAQEAHRRALAERWPRLATRLGASPFEHTWGGWMAISRNGRHFFGALADGIWGAAGYNAAGIALGTACGELLADLALGHESPRLADMLALPGPSWLPPEPLLTLGARWRIARMERASGGRI